jgi:hypothetical protein
MKNMLQKAAFLPSVLALIPCIALPAVLTTCADETVTVKSDEKSIISFKIDNAAGAILEDEISVVVPEGTDLSKLSPVIEVSHGNARVTPASGVEVDFTHPTTYVVIAEDGTARTYVVTVRPEATLSSLSVLQTPYKTRYETGTELELDGLVVRGNYSDGSYKIEDITDANISNYDKDVVGTQSVIISIDDRMVTFSVTVGITLSSISVLQTPYKTTYDQGTELDLTGLVVMGYYSDGSYNVETVTDADISNYDKDSAGYQQVIITIHGKTTSFSVTVQRTSPLILNIEFVNNGNDNLEIYGIPEGGIKLSKGKRNDLPDSIVISAGGTSNGVYNSIQWYIDATQVSSYENIITIYANQYTFTQPHTITIVATKDGATHSKTITFTVEL